MGGERMKNALEYDLSLRSIVDALGLRNGWISVLAYYGDDSGSASRDGVFAVGGYLAESPTWFYDLEIPWNEVLNEAPRIKYFKGFECQKLTGQFEGFERDEADAKLDSLVDVIVPSIASARVHEYGSVIRWDDYNRCITGKLRKAFPNPYFFCFHGLVDLISRAYLEATETPARPVAYVFDHQSNLESKAYEHYWLVYRHASDGAKRTMGSISFADDRGCPPLQMADLIAWHVRRDFLNPKNDLGRQRPALRALREKLKDGRLAIWKPDGLRQFAADVEANPAV
jgi:hypothetical protein